jgi:transposase
VIVIARPSKLNAERAHLITRVVRGGLTIPTAARLAGVSPRTVWRWLERGRQPGRRHARHRALLAAVERARAELETDLVARMTLAAARGQWKAAAWLLEREHFDRWGRPEDRLLAREEARTG